MLFSAVLDPSVQCTVDRGRWEGRVRALTQLLLAAERADNKRRGLSRQSALR